MSDPPQIPDMETCPDDHHCLNGSKCVENPYREGSYYCDCREVDFEAAYEGLRCEHRADVYCVVEGISKHSFCTNDGICVEEVGPDSAHMGCECTENYEGSFCQFVKGSKPKGYPFMSEEIVGRAESGRQRGEGAVWGGVVVGVCIGSVVVGMVMYYLMNQRPRSKDTHDLLVAPVNDNCDGRDLHLDADGEALTHAMEESMRKSYSDDEEGVSKVVDVKFS